MPGNSLRIRANSTGARQQSSRAARFVVALRCRWRPAAGWPAPAGWSRLRNRPPEVVANTTDPQSRIMPTRKGYLQGYNTQVAVSADQIIVAVQVGQATTDQTSFVPMVNAEREAAALLHAHTGNEEHVIGTVLDDAGYASDTILASPDPARLIALGKNLDQFRAAKTSPATGPPPPGATPRQAIEHRLRTTEGVEQYKRRGATVEPGIGNLRKIIDRFSRRGLDNALSEIQLAATVINLLKINRASA